VTNVFTEHWLLTDGQTGTGGRTQAHTVNVTYLYLKRGNVRR